MTWSAIFPLSDFFNAFAMDMETSAVAKKSRPYRACGIKESKFSATNVVK